MSEDRDATATPPKYSRYRSVRQQAQSAKPEPPPPPAPPIPDQQQQQQDGFSRTKSMSRYRRSRVVGKNELAEYSMPPPVPSVPIPSRTQTSAAQPPAIRNPTRRVTEPAPSAYAAPPAGREARPKETERERLRRKAQEYRDREEAQRKLEEQEARQLAEEEAERERLKEEEAARILAEQKRKDLERLQAELDAAPIPPKILSPSKEKFGFFSRKRAATKSAPPRTSESGSRSGTNSTSMSRTRSIEPSRGIVEGGGGIVPQTDAPMSAVNAGERRVLIRCKQSSINLPITPETTPVDIIFSAANIMTQNITPSTAVLLESYTQLGLERRVRRYEHIRDIMNSWDRDTQNALLLQNSDSPNHDYDLETSAAPKEAPPDVTVYMYHSQRPGKWNKRHITLLSSGQIYIAKKPNLSISDKDASPICHLSDFDIYSSTPQYTRKTLKPPKKYCHAIKSQQKTTMFLSTENFVHYFSTDDSTLSHKWYAAVQRWRSWYLVNRMDQGAKKAKAKTKPTANHALKLSVDENP
ncbi:hypothetical protein LSUE1_G009529 [Lachnellula suecica]|uniref:PH domain-containing protein n=1 Tax=Lachnellula suecica TaxID=602035 RepID=A0A8T9BR52_9HELO|nr:hypothetical protein LSUE1_G009529 [Lachnellula suecica]